MVYSSWTLLRVETERTDEGKATNNNNESGPRAEPEFPGLPELLDKKVSLIEKNTMTVCYAQNTDNMVIFNWALILEIHAALSLSFSNLPSPKRYLKTQDYLYP